MAVSGGSVRIDYHDFPSAPAIGAIEVSEAALDRAAIGVGNLNAFVGSAPSTVRAIAQQWRIAVTRDSIQLDRGEWRRADEYDRLERTEKGFMSGLLGGVLSKLVAEYVFGVREFGHIEYFSPSPVYDFRSRRRPDFLGLPARSGQSAVVVESKGRSKYFPGYTAQVKQAKKQVGSVLSVPGFPTVQRYVQYTHFDDGVLVVSLYDPPGPEDGDTDNDSYSSDRNRRKIDVREYYRDVVDAADAFDVRVVEMGGLTYRLFNYDLLDISVGIPESIYQAVREDQPLLADSGRLLQVGSEDVATESRLWRSEERGPSRDNTEVLADVGSDGLLVVGDYPVRQ